MPQIMMLVVACMVKWAYRIAGVAIPTYYGDEICYVNGIPYALHCIWEAVKFAVVHRWRVPKVLPVTTQSVE